MQDFSQLTFEQAAKRANELSEQLQQHNYRYYVLAEPTISDFEFDQLLAELIQIEQLFPQLEHPNSPTQRVGGQVTKVFAQVAHKYPMLSLGNTYSIADLLEFDSRVSKGLQEPYAYVCELKFDGVAIGLTYENGFLVQAVTRGDGEYGDDVTHNVRTIQSVPLQLMGDYPARFEIRGEIVLPRAAFDQINQEREEIGELPLANPRNAAAGTIKMQNSKVVAARALDCYLYALLGEQLPFDNHYESLERARTWGFKISNTLKRCSSIQEVMHFINHWDIEREKLAFDIDGVVIKVNDYRQQRKLGFTAKSPRWAISYKFTPERAETELEKVTFQVGRTGAITPVANLKPVLLAGTVVKRASLHNHDIIQKLDVREGDFVFVEKGGEIIPKIVGVNFTKRKPALEPLLFIGICPECGAQLERKAGESAHFCPNEAGCPPQIKGKIEHFVARRAMDINSLGKETIAQLYDAGLIRNIADLYDLKAADLLQLDRMAEKSVLNLLQGLEKSKSVTFHRVLFALGIRHVGETTANKLATVFRSVQNLAKASMAELLEAGDIGQVIAQSVHDFFNDPAQLQTIDRLKAHGLKFELEGQQEMLSNRLTGKIFVISGTFSNHSRDALKKTIELHGGKHASSVSGNTTYLLAGEKTGPEKLKKAEKLGVQIISEIEFEKLIHTND